MEPRDKTEEDSDEEEGESEASGPGSVTSGHGSMSSSRSSGESSSYSWLLQCLLSSFAKSFGSRAVGGKRFLESNASSTLGTLT